MDFGGGLTGTKTVFVYDFISEKRKKKAEMKYERYSHALIKLNKGIFVFGGRTVGGNIK